MTATQASPFGFPHAQLALLRQFGRWSVRGGVALAIIVLAGMLAVATAIAGLALALGAVMIQLFARADRTRPATAPGAAKEGITLTARRTPRGWTVE